MVRAVAGWQVSFCTWKSCVNGESCVLLGSRHRSACIVCTAAGAKGGSAGFERGRNLSSFGLQSPLSSSLGTSMLGTLGKCPGLEVYLFIFIFGMLAGTA